jgi:Lon protease-like protein
MLGSYRKKVYANDSSLEYNGFMLTQLQTIPLFPLGLTLYPGGMVDLKIFEVRYLDMVKDCVANHTSFGIVTLDEGNEVVQADGGKKPVAFFETGTIAEITYFDAPQPSLFFIKCKGGQRFKVHRKEQQKNGLWMGDVEYLANDVDTPIEAEHQQLANNLGAIIASLQKKGVAENQMPFAQPYELEQCGWVANRWCDILPLTPAQKHHLLSIENPRIRLDLVKELIEEMTGQNLSE